MAEHISCNNHIYFNSINSKPVHAQKLGKKCIPMTLHNKLQNEKKKTEIRIDIYYINIYLDFRYKIPRNNNFFPEYLCGDKPSKNYAEMNPLRRKSFFF